jgi:hypothetical protein
LAKGLPTPLERVRKLQISLQTKAKAEPAFRFYSLWDKVCRVDVLAEAYRACRRNGGAAGADGVTFDQIAAYGTERWLEELRQKLCAGEYRSQPLQRWLMRRSGQAGTGYRHHPDEYLYETLGLYCLPLCRADPPSAKV